MFCCSGSLYDRYSTAIHGNRLFPVVWGFWCVCVCMCVVWGTLCGGVHRCACGSPRLRIILSGSSTVLTEGKSHNQTRSSLAGLVSLGSLLWGWHHKWTAAPSPRSISVSSGIWTLILTLGQQGLSLLSHLPNPLSSFLKHNFLFSKSFIWSLKYLKQPLH